MRKKSVDASTQQFPSHRFIFIFAKNVQKAVELFQLFLDAFYLNQNGLNFVQRFSVFPKWNVPSPQRFDQIIEIFNPLLTPYENLHPARIANQVGFFVLVGLSTEPYTA
ncbi:MAG: hypothetical protein WBW53_02710 [Terriglobales bacterium]